MSQHLFDSVKIGMDILPPCPKCRSQNVFYMAPSQYGREGLYGCGSCSYSASDFHDQRIPAQSQSSKLWL